MNPSEYEHLVEELVRIGRQVKDPTFSSSGFIRRRLLRSSIDPRARKIGRKLNQMGGWEMMSKANKRVAATLGHLAAHDLSRAWHGIGDWLH